MTESPFQDVLSRSSWAELEELLQERLPSLEDLRLLLAHPHSGVVDAGLRFLETRLQAGFASLEERLAWAKLLPTEIAHLAPRHQVRLAGLYTALVRWHPTGRLPWNDPEQLRAKTPTEEGLAWFRALCLTRPSLIAAMPGDEWLYQALRDITFFTLPSPREMLLVLSEHTDGYLHTLALELLREGITQAALAPGFVFDRLLQLFGRAGNALKPAILAEIAAPWALLHDCPRRILQEALASPEGALQKKAIEALDAWGAADLLADAFLRGSLPPARLRDMMEPLGRHGDAALLDAIVAVTRSDPPFYGRAFFEALQRFHQRGIFLRDHHLPELLEIHQTHRDVFPDLFVRLTYTSRYTFFQILSELPLRSELWEAYLPFLHSLEVEGVGSLLRRLLAAHTHTNLCDPILTLLAQRQIHEAEADILALLEIRPRSALAALRHLGSEATILALFSHLGLQPPTQAASPAIQPYQEEALVLLWQLLGSQDPRRKEILAHLDPTSLPPAILIDLMLPARPPEIAFLCKESFSSLRAHEALRLLCRHALPEDLPLLKALLIRHVQELHLGDLQNEEGPKHGYHAEATIYTEVRDAIRELGQRWSNQQKIRPLCLLRVTNPLEAGDGLLASLLLEILQGESFTLGEEIIFLETLESLHDPAIAAHLVPRLRHKDPHLRKHVIRCLAHQRASGLLASLGAFTRAGDIQTIRQALLALRDLGARHAAYLVTPCLDHPTMNLKKTAAEVLQKIGGIDAIPRLLRGLQTNDNPGFRSLLLGALDAILGPMATTSLVFALEKASDDSSRHGLLQALQHRLSPSQLYALAMCESPSFPLLLEALEKGHLHLKEAEADPASLRAIFRLYGLPLPLSLQEKPSKKPKAEDEGLLQKLRDEGWQSELARELLFEQRPITPPLQALFQRDLRSWLFLYPHLHDSEKQEMLRLLLGVSASAWKTADLTLLTPKLRRFAEHLPASPEAYRAFLELALVCHPFFPPIERTAFLDLLRGMAYVSKRDGSLLLRVFRLYDASLTRSDLERFLVGCEETPDPSRSFVSLLCDVFRLAPPFSSADPDFTDGLDEVIREARRDLLDDLRSRYETLIPHNALLIALLRAYAEAFYHRPLLLDWILSLQPLNLPPWQIHKTLCQKEEKKSQREEKKKLAPKATDPRLLEASLLRYEALWDALGDEELQKSEAAFQSLLSWSDLRALRPILARLYLHHPRWEKLPSGQEDHLARALLHHPRLCLTPLPSEGWPFPRPLFPLGLRLFDEASKEEVPSSSPTTSLLLSLPDLVQRKFLRLTHALPPLERVDLLPWFFPLWTSQDSKIAADALRLLTSLPADHLLPYVVKEVAKGSLQATILLQGPLTPSDEVDRLLLLLHHGSLEEAERLRSLLQRRGLRTRSEALAEAEALEALTKRRPVAGVPKRTPREEEADLLTQIQATSDLETLRVLFKELLRWKETHHLEPTIALLDGLQELTSARDKRVRSLAYRTFRALASKDLYLRVTLRFLSDPRPDVQRSAIRTLAYARYIPAIPALVDFLTHKKPQIRAAAAHGLSLFEDDAVSALLYARDHARPDHIGIYEAVLQRIYEKTEDPPSSS